MTKIRTYRPISPWLVALSATLGASTVALAQPANDLCTSAITVTAGSSTNGTNVAATSDIAESSCSFGDALDVWFSFTAGPAGGQYTIDTEGSTGLLDTTLSIYSACGGAETQCDDDAGTNFLSSILVTLAPNQNIKIRVAGYDGDTGAFRLNVSTPLLTGGTDLCPAATVVTAGNSYVGDNTGATSDIAATSCAFTPTDNFDVWFSFTPSATAFYRINTNGSTVLDDTTLSIWADCSGATELFCDDDGGAGLLSELNVLLNVGTNYRIRVAGWDGGVGQFLLNIGAPVAPPTAPANDNCVGATLIATLPYQDNTTDIAGATADADLASCNDPAATSTPSAVWYRYVAPSNKRLRITENSPLNTFFAVFTSSDTTCGGLLTEVVGSCDFDTFIDVTGGTTYYILVGAAGTASLPPPAVIDLTVVEVIPPANDTCASPQNIPTLPATVTGTNLGAGSDVPSTSCAFTPTDDLDVWYTFTAVATPSGTTLITTSGSTGLQDTTLALYATCAGSELACDDDGAEGLLSRIVATLIPGNVYWVRVAGWNHQFGDFQLSIGAGPTILPLDNDTCATAATLSGSVNAEEDSLLAQNEGTDAATTCNDAGAVGIDNSIWFTFTPGSSGALTGSIDAAYDALAVLYTGSCGSLSEVACWDEPQPFDLTAPDSGSSALTGGTQYYLVIGDWGQADGGGATTLNLTIPGGAAGGACCSGSTCVAAAGAGACTGANTLYAGNGTVCNVFGVNNTTPCCLADYNHLGGVGVQDIFDFLAGYFSSNPQADINGGGIGVQDIFDFLAAYFAGCP